MYTLKMELMDYEVVGIGGLSRKEIEELRKTQNLSLVIHRGLPWDQNLFAAALEGTLRWLQPDKIEHVIWPKEKWKDQIKQAAYKLFPRAHQHLGDKFEVLVEGYNVEVELQEWLPAEHYRHFPIYLRQLHFSKPETELIRYELMQSLLKTRDMGECKPVLGNLQINPTIQVFDNQNGDLFFVPKPGLYLMYVEFSTHEIRFDKISEKEALILDLLSEELPLNSTSDWKGLIQQMQIKGLLF
jgi:hypothetical protein